MPTQLQLRRGTTTEHSTFAGAVGEVTIDTTKDTAVVHDGATNGGYPLAKETGSTFGNSNVSGNITYADNSRAIFGGGSDLQIYSDGTTGQIVGDINLAGNLNFADNEKAQFGAGSDLQIYHDALDSYIQDSGTGNLFIGGTNLFLRSATGETYLGAVQDGAVTLYHDNNPKLATTSSGIDVTGTVVSDGMSTNTAGTSNFIAGLNAGNSLASGSFYNVLVGDQAGEAITTGDYNIAIGHQAMESMTGGQSNIAIGYQALQTANTASGQQFNVAIGDLAGRNVTTGSLNTLVGGLAGDVLDTGIENVALGYNALGADVKGNNSIAIGSKALQAQSFSGATDAYNTAVGHNAGKTVSTGIQNTLIGGLAGDALSDADYNVAVGTGALSADTKGGKTVAIGHSALANQNFTTSQDSNNTAVGDSAGALTTTGKSNTFIGLNAGYSNQTGESNVYVGTSAGATATGTKNTFLGRDSGSSITTGNNNTILGRYNGNQGGLDIRTSSNNIVISDGDGNPRLHIDSSGVVKNTDFIIPFPAGSAPTGTFTHYNNGSQQSTDASHQNMPVACALKVKAIYLYVNGALSTGSATVSLQKNAGAVASISVTTGVNAFNSTGLSISYVAGDRMGIKIVGTGTSSAWYNVSVLCERA